MRLAVCVLTVLAAIGSAQGSIFSVGHAAYIASNGKIKFDNILADNDGSWDVQKGHFRCSDPGYYYISFHGLGKRNSGLTLKLMQNRAEVARAFADGSGYNTASNSAIVYLYNGDTISLRVDDGFVHESDHLDRNFVTLSGYKIPNTGDDGGPQFGPGGSGGVGFGAAPPGGAAGEEGGASPPEDEKEEDFKPLTPDSSGPTR